MEEALLASVIEPEVESVKTRFKNRWMDGDSDRFSRFLEGSARDFYEPMSLLDADY